MSKFTELPNLWIPLSDGRSLAARLWLPDDTCNNPVPAILEYLPYRKRDGTAPRDESTYPVFAANGYAGIRVDTAGQGESDGEFIDEYSEQELTDGVEVIHWVAQQDWCNGNVGMMGISWGGFNSLQIATKQPEPLKAVISLSSVVDRYHHDIHYKNGCQLYSNFSWATVMLCFASRAPDPQLRDDWRDVWLHRLNTQPWLLENWLEHQRRDAYWKHGSVCDVYPSLTTPTLIIGGWADLYVNAPVSALENLTAPCKAIIGPWIHKYPHFAWPKPRLDFHQEAIAWWDRWLKGVDNGVEDKPAYRAFISENTRATKLRQQEQGRWIEEPVWPSPDTLWMTLHPGLYGQLLPRSSSGDDIVICSPQDCGTACGEVFTLKPDSELSGDQRNDDAGSEVFETEILTDEIELLGAPAFTVDVAIDKPLGNLVVRLCDVHPDGMSHRISWGVLNLAHRHDSENPQIMQPGVFETITLTLDQCGYRLLTGHRLRLCVSTAYWPTILPPPETVTATIRLETAALHLPTRSGGDRIDVPAPTNQNPLPVYTQHSPAHSKRWVENDLQNHQTRYCIYDDTGEDEMPDHGLRTRYLREEQYSITPDDPLTSQATATHTFWLSRGDWSVVTTSESALTCDASHFYLTAKVCAYENENLVNVREWKKTIRRDFM